MKEAMRQRMTARRAAKSTVRPPTWWQRAEQEGEACPVGQEGCWQSRSPWESQMKTEKRCGPRRRSECSLPGQE